MTILCIAGHGKSRSGGFDPGATGFIGKGEHKYMKENLFPAMKRYVGGADVVFFSEYDVYSYGNIVQLASKYGRDTVVVEFHYDASSSDARGGHIIVKSKYSSDKLDLKLRDVVKSMVGVRYNHRGESGISGRDNLANVNRTASAGVNYRLVELGFGTNKTDSDVLVNKTDEYARKLMEALTGKTYVQNNKSVTDIAKEVIAGKWGDNPSRATKLVNAGYSASQVQTEVNRLAGGSTPAKKSNTVIAKEVIAGKWGNNPSRASKLRSAGYDSNAVQKEVNRLL